MGLFTPKWKGSDLNKALQAVENEKNEQKLREMATAAPLSEVRKKAVEKITDDPFLREIALNDADPEVRKTALFRISKEEYLPVKEKGCEYFGMEHIWSSGTDCTDTCGLCGAKKVHHVWKNSVCVKCGVKLADGISPDQFRLSDLLDPAKRGVVVNALTYALSNWGDSEEESKIKALIEKCKNGDVLKKEDVILLLRAFRVVKQMFPDNRELRIDEMDILNTIARKM